MAKNELARREEKIVNDLVVADVGRDDVLYPLKTLTNYGDHCDRFWDKLLENRPDILGFASFLGGASFGTIMLKFATGDIGLAAILAWCALSTILVLYMAAPFPSWKRKRREAEVAAQKMLESRPDIKAKLMLKEIMPPSQE